MNFCMLILYPATLLNSLVVTVFFQRSLRMSVYKIIYKMTSRDICKLSSSRDSFNSLNLDAFKVFFFLFGLIAGAKPSSTVLNRSVQGAHSCLIPDVKKKNISDFDH